MTDSRIFIRMSDSCLAACHEFRHRWVRAGDSCPAGWLGRREIRAGPLEEHSCKARGGNKSAAGGLHAAAAAAEHCHPAAGWARLMLTVELFSSKYGISWKGTADAWLDLCFSGVCWVAAAVCMLAAGVRQPERRKNGSFRKTAVPGGWTQQVDIGVRYTLFSPERVRTIGQWLNLPQLCFILLISLFISPRNWFVQIRHHL